MRSWNTRGSSVARGGAVLSLAVLASCGYAKRDDVDAEFAQLRSEVESADQALDQRIGDVDSRVNGLEQRTAALEQDLQALRNDFNTTIERMEGLLSFAVPVNFEFDEAIVRGPDQEVLARFAAVVMEYYPNAVVTVEGFTDPVGSVEYNQQLGLRRAEAVKELLVHNGLVDANVRAVSYGKSADRLLSQEGGPERGEENRRVSLVIDYTGTGLMMAPETVTTMERATG